ncbi:MAG: Npt1/Npt2 family nucleotide transporter [Pseudomonadota bacterium]
MGWGNGYKSVLRIIIRRFDEKENINLKNTLAAIFNFREGEGRPLVFLLIHSFLMGLTIIFYDTAASALFLSQFNADDLPYVYICTAIVLPVVGIIHKNIEDKISVEKLFTGTLLFVMLSIFLLRGLLGITDTKWPVVAVFLWLEVVTVLVSLEFWGLAAQIFDVRQGKRLFSLIGAGEVAAIILAGFSAGWIVLLVGTKNLLFCSALSTGASVFVLRLIIRSFPEHLKKEDEEAEEFAGAAESTRELFKTKYIKLIFLLSAISVVGYFFIDFAFYDQIDLRYKDSQKLAQFFGAFFAISGIVNLISRSFLSGRLINRYGLSFGLLALPVMLLFGSGAVTISGLLFAGTAMIFWLVVMVKLFDAVVRPTTEEPSILILYQPLPGKRRLGVQICVGGIIEPIGMGVAGVLLLVLTNIFTFTTVHAVGFLIFILILWITVAIILRKEYTAVLMKALTNRSLGGATLSLNDASSVAILEKGLKSPLAGEVLYCLNMLEEIEHDTLSKFLMDLIHHDDIVVRKEVLRRIARLKIIDALNIVAERIRDEEAPDVKGFALTTLCSLGETDVIDMVLPYLDHHDPDIRKGAMVGLLRSGGIEGVLAGGESLMALIGSGAAAQRRLAGEVLGEIGIRRFYRPLIRLLSDDDAGVRQAALIAAGRVCNPRLWPLVIENLSVPEVREAAFSALVRGAESVVNDLEKSFLREDQNRNVRMKLIQIAGRIRSPESVEFLLKNINFPDLHIRHRVLRSLSVCGFHAEDDRKSFIKTQIFDEIKNAAWTLAAMLDLGEDAEYAVLYRALQNEIDRCIARIALLLSFIYPSASILKAMANLISNTPGKRAYATEAFDNLLSQDLKDTFLPLIDNINNDQKLRHLRRISPQERLGKHERLSAMITRPLHFSSDWSKTCSLYILGKAGLEKYAYAARKALKSSDETMRETAVWALARISPDDIADHIKDLVHDPSEKVSKISRHLMEFAGLQKGSH